MAALESPYLRKIMDEISEGERVINEFGRFDRRDRAEKSWHVPSRQLCKILKLYSPIVSVYSGLCLTEFAATRAEGADIICTDIKPAPNNWCLGRPLMPVMRARALKAIRRYPHRNVFMAWPPHRDRECFWVLYNMRPGQFLIYVGESMWGCTGGDWFHEMLAEEFDEIHRVKIPQFWGIHDECLVYQKRVDWRKRYDR